MRHTYIVSYDIANPNIANPTGLGETGYDVLSSRKRMFQGRASK